MPTKNDTNQIAPQYPAANDVHLQKVNQEIYKHNLELAIVNKTLSLLRKLYQISLLSLDPASLSEKISETVRVDLNLETAGILTFDKQSDSLAPFTFSKSERLAAVINQPGFLFLNLKITNISKNPILKQVAYDKNPAITDKLENVWQGIIDSEKLKIAAEKSHIKTILLYPLVAQNLTIGILLLGLNRDYKILNEHEKESIKSLIDVVAVGLEKALLYEELKEANEKLKVLDLARAEFISIASHQLRTPPATVKWYLSSILAGDYGRVPKNIKDIVAKTERCNNLLISLIEDILNVSRIERGTLEFLFEKVDPLELATLTFEQLEPLAKEKNLILEFIKPKHPLPNIMADKEKLRQVINNLIDNAIKYTSEGKVEMSLFKEGENIRFQVKDSGKGINAKEISRIFEKYIRGKGSIHLSAGLGLGLYVAKIVILQHKGKIWAESPGEGKGSTFIFTIPIKTDIEHDSSVDLKEAITKTPA